MCLPIIKELVKSSRLAGAIIREVGVMSKFAIRRPASTRYSETLLSFHLSFSQNSKCDGRFKCNYCQH
uniref:Uncharacterized protein n=1 Tax=Onchocerca volvulus TaxID=6282 RepID=A0A8R1XX33_ONCVO